MSIRERIGFVVVFLVVATLAVLYQVYLGGSFGP